MHLDTKRWRLRISAAVLLAIIALIRKDHRALFVDVFVVDQQGPGFGPALLFMHYLGCSKLHLARRVAFTAV